jgi:hypothetical protein
MGQSATGIVGFLARLKRGKAVAVPDEPETLPELLGRVDRPGAVAEIRREAYFGFLERCRDPVRLLFHFFAVEDGPAVRLFWFDHRKKRYFARRLSAAEAQAFAARFGVPGLRNGQEGPPSSGRGFGPFRLGDLVAGERFLTDGDEPAQVCRAQKRGGPGVAVWLAPDGLSARPAALPREAVVFVTSEEQARRVRRRVGARLRRANPKGEGTNAR